MVEYHIHDGSRKLAAAEQLASEYAPAEDIQSLRSEEYFVLSVESCQLVIDLRRHKYDLRVESDTIGKYTSWQEAKAKFAQLLDRRVRTTQEH